MLWNNLRRIPLDALGCEHFDIPLLDAMLSSTLYVRDRVPSLASSISLISP